jgi:PAS domain S-box-containing protein
MPTFHFTKKRFVISVLCALFMVTAAGWVFTGYLVGMATRIVERELENANAVISINLTSELKRIEGAATAVAGSPLTLPLLQANTPENMEKANNILDRYHKALDAAACYLIDKNGLTLTSSNRNDKDSFVGQNYTFRSYFQQAIKGGIGHLFAYGTVSKRRGFYASAPVRDKAGQVVGVVTIKKEIEDIETKLSQYSWFLLDQSGIIFMSSQPEARLKSLWPLSDEQQQKIILSKQYGPGPFEPVLQKPFKDKAEVTFQGGQYLASQNATPYEGVSVVLLWPTGQISMYRSFGIMLTLLALLLTLSFLAAVYTFTQSNFRMKTLLKETQLQAAALAESEGQLRDRRNELEGQKEILAQAEERSRLLLGAIGEGIFGVDNEGRVIFLNPAASTILGYTEEEMLGVLLHEQVHYAYPDGSEFPWLQCSTCLTSQDGKSRTVDNEVFWRKDGIAVPVEYTTTPVSKGGQVVAAVVSFHDITERKRAEGLKVGKEVAEAAAARAEQARQAAERAKEELKAKVSEIERFNRLALGREERIIELKKQVNALAVKVGEQTIYQEHEPAEGLDEGLARAESTLQESQQAEMASDSMAEMLSLDQFKRLLVDFCESAGVAAAIIDLKGEVLAAARWQRACTDFHRINERTCARCIESDTELALNLNEGKPFSVYRCKNGLTDAASPIIVEGKHIANAFTGQFFTSPPDMEFFRRQAEECGLEAEQYLEAIREVPVVAENKLVSVLGFLVGVAQTMSTMAMERNRARQAEIAIAKRIEEIKSERIAAMSLAEDADQARAEVEQFKSNLELLVQQRTDELQASEERSRLILSSMSEGIFGMDAGGRVTFVNQAAMALLGYTEEELIGKLMHAEVHYAYPDGSEFPRLQCPMYLSSRDGQSRTVDNEVLWHKDGTAVPVEYTTTPVLQDGQVVGTVVSFRDIAERKETEEQIKAYFNSSSDGLLILSLERGFIHANQTAVAMFGFESITDLIKCGPIELSPPYQPDGRPSQEAAMEYITKAMQMDTPLHFDWIHRRTDGTEFPCEISLTNIVIAGRQQLLTIIHDITERKQMEQKIIAEGERLKSILETAPLNIAFSTKGRIHFANPLFSETFGAKIGDASPQLYVHPEERETLIELMKRDGIAREQEIQMYDRHKRVRDMLVTFLPINYDGEDGVLGWLTDITERKQAERELQEQMDELERFSHLTINREEKMIELKEEINTLLEQAGREKKYKIVES